MSKKIFLTSPGDIFQRFNMLPGVRGSGQHPQSRHTQRNRLYEDEGEDEIPQEEIQQYLKEVSEQREKLRRNLKQRFSQLCIDGL